MTQIEILTTDGQRHYVYNPDEDEIDSLKIIDALDELGIKEEEVIVVSLED